MRREEENNQSSNQSNKTKGFNAKQLLRKRWMLPAIYLGAAAIVLSAFFFMQGGNEALPTEDSESQDGLVYQDGEAVPVNSSNETFKMPVADENEVEVIGYFYDYDASSEEQQAALVYYNNTYYQNKGIDIASKGEESFDVTAALSGTVVKAEEDSLLGYVIQINHDNGVVTHYQSLGNVEVEEGATVKQGDIIGRAGRNLYNSDAGVHVHFEIRHNGEAVNPLDYINQSVVTLIDEAHRMNEEIASAEEDEVTEEEGASEEEVTEEAADEEEVPEEDASEEDDAKENTDEEQEENVDQGNE